MNGPNFRFFFLPCRYISWRRSDCYRERKRLHFQVSVRMWANLLLPLHASRRDWLLQSSRIFSWRPRLPMPTFQVRISFLGSQDTALPFLFLSLQDLQISKLSHFSRLSCWHPMWIHSVWRCFRGNNFICYVEETTGLAKKFIRISPWCYFWPTQCFINKYKFCYDQFILLSIILPWLPVLPLSLNEFRNVWFNYINHILMTTQEEGLSSTGYCSMIYLL